ncbi:EAL domain-containing protein [Modestobacter sp. VKM Ac-2979]|uniref:putative bifunctional diguanylate cyclase/phosphodiesterase n=1 Tax=unclassified Modestobacter TaxID=2643866 RepID=UPI0022AB7BDE|nr:MULTISPECIES: EAL domain-containing protein [unclassified Modestobacter]MCZ2813855.1 EAL domain-containing protein [Modestobacter sp. VKM Ac-2979]MCZ2844170.1 EAL domain-containing protein [Modestobacter sp. VKM Ac-2980]
MRQVRSRAPEVATPRMTARILAVFYAFGGVAGLLAALGATPHPERNWAVTGVATSALLGAIVLARWGTRWPRGAFHVPVAGATALIGAAVALAPDPLTSLAIASIVSFVAVDAFFFFRPGPALLHLGTALVGTSTVLVLRGDVPVATALALVTVVVALGTVTRALAWRASSASRDPLTGLANRRGFDASLQELLCAAARRGEPLSAALLDLDHFKRINDTDGHEAGDRVLVRVAEAWGAELPPHAVLARHGGDEFALLLPGLTGPVALAELERLTALHPGIGVSCGVAQHAPGESGAQLMRRADAALYVAKDAGRDRCALDGARGTQLSTELAAAVAAGQLGVAFQPVVELVGNRVIGVEALARWESPGRGAVPPDEFIALAEQHGLIAPLGELVLRTSLVQLTALRETTGVQLVLGVNVSVRELADPDYPQRVAALLTEFGWPADHVVVEVTETQLESDVAVVRQNLETLMRLGLVVAADDFGTGYSSLSRIDVLPVQHLKLDTSFIASITTSPRRAQLLASIVALADNLGLGLVAEGVETVEQDAELRRLGVLLAQGWLYGRPMSVTELAVWLADRSVDGAFSIAG